LDAGNPIVAELKSRDGHKLYGRMSKMPGPTQDPCVLVHSSSQMTASWAPAELEALETILRAGPEKAGFPNGLWTLDRIAHMIREEFGIDYHSGRVWWILQKKLGWSCQRPVGRAREGNEAAIRDWKQNVWPALKKKPRKKAGSSSL
jgi:hypothetical protein